MMTYQAQGGLPLLYFALRGGGGATYGSSEEFAKEIEQANKVIAGIQRQDLPASIPWSNARELYIAADELLRAGAMHTAYQQAENTTFEAPADQARYAGNRAQRAYMQYMMPLSNLLKETRSGGPDGLVPTALFQTNIPKAINAATDTYTALAYLLDIRPGAVRFMDGATKLYNKVGAAWAAALRTMKETIWDPTLKALDDIERWTKWGITATVVGGAAYIIYKISQSRR